MSKQRRSKPRRYWQLSLAPWISRALSSRVAMRFQERASRMLLDFAESLPVAAAGPLKRLQGVRRRQRDNAERGSSRSQPQKGSGLAFVGIHLTDLFEVEEFEELERGVQSLFPESPRAIQALRYLRSNAGSLGHYSTHSLGRISSQRDAGFTLVDPSSHDPALGPHFSFVEIALHRFLPSMYALSFQFHLADEASRGFVAAPQAVALPPFRFTGPAALRFYSWSERSLEDAKSNAAREAADLLRRAAARWIRRYSRGSQVSRGMRVESLVQSLDYFRVEGFPETEDSALVWISKSRGWLAGYSLEILPEVMRSGRALLLLNRRTYQSRGVPAAIVSLSPSQHPWESFETGHHVAVALSLGDYISATRRELERRRARIFRAVRSRSRVVRWTSFSEISALDGIVFLARRLNAEIEYGSNLANLLSEVESFAGEERYWPGGNLRSALARHYPTELRALLAYVGFIRESLSEQLTLRNVQATFVLQILAILLALKAAFDVDGAFLRWLPPLP